MTPLDVQGRIFDIQRYSIHDGPGIRTIVFLKGCALRCRWCCNPEGQDFAIQTMHMPGKDKIMGRDVTVAQVIAEVEKDRPYYRRGNGGLTLSGGECLCQSDFAAALLQAAKERGIHTAIESTACVEYAQIEKVLPWLDTFLMDIKHMDSAKHQAFTGIGNERILENAARLARDAQRLIIRVPTVPTFNDTEAEIADIAFFAANLPNVKQLHLLPYHRLGQDKYSWLGREYTLPRLTPPDDEKMERLLKAAQVSGLQCQIGG